ncbi:hypothetical protein PENSPDRAFT_653311 [Peniophora sp. CONT]|nr:hypothetical protein PENSPDRAFT_653311 [Peniophora sp. CONT]
MLALLPRVLFSVVLALQLVPGFAAPWSMPPSDHVNDAVYLRDIAGPPSYNVYVTETDNKRTNPFAGGGNIEGTGLHDSTRRSPERPTLDALPGCRACGTGGGFWSPG